MKRPQARSTASYRAHLRWRRRDFLSIAWLKRMVAAGKIKPIRIRGYDQDQHKWPCVSIICGETQLASLPLEMVRW